MIYFLGIIEILLTLFCAIIGISGLFPPYTGESVACSLVYISFGGFLLYLTVYIMFKTIKETYGKRRFENR